MKRRLVSGLAGILVAAVLIGNAMVPDVRAATQGGMTIAAAINQAGRQRMLSQRLAKAWLMIGQDIQPQQAWTILQDSLSRFETQLAELQGFTPNADVHDALMQLERAWADYKTALASVPNLAHARQIYATNEVVQEAAHRLTLAYEKLAPEPTYRLVNIAGRQRMLSQRMAKFYLFRVWGVNTGAASMEINFARAEFSSGMHQLYSTLHTNPDIKAALERLDREWVAYREALLAPSDAAGKKRAAMEVAERSERVLESCEQLVTLFERQAGAAAR